jgi:hypothetical protein
MTEPKPRIRATLAQVAPPAPPPGPARAQRLRLADARLAGALPARLAASAAWHRQHDGARWREDAKFGRGGLIRPLAAVIHGLYGPWDLSCPHSPSPRSGHWGPAGRASAASR